MINSNRVMVDQGSHGLACLVPDQTNFNLILHTGSERATHWSHELMIENLPSLK